MKQNDDFKYLIQIPNFLSEEKCDELKMEMPILSEIYEILYHGKRPGDALVALMGRELKQER